MHYRENLDLLPGVQPKQRLILLCKSIVKPQFTGIIQGLYTLHIVRPNGIHFGIPLSFGAIVTYTGELIVYKKKNKGAECDYFIGTSQSGSTA